MLEAVCTIIYRGRSALFRMALLGTAMAAFYSGCNGLGLSCAMSAAVSVSS